MKNVFLLIALILGGVAWAHAAGQGTETKRYVVANKDGKARFVEVESKDGKWLYVKNREDIYIDNGVEIEGFEIEADPSLNYTGTPYVYRQSILFEYNGKHYLVVSPEKDIKAVDENGEVTSDLGWRNYLSNTALGDFYRTSAPGLIALACALLAAIFMFWSIFKDPVPMFIRYCYAIPVSVISLIEIGAAFSVGTDAAWWVNPDTVGYLVATPLLIPYSLVAALMVFSYKLYGVVGKLSGAANAVASTLMVIGIILTVVSAIYVVVNFLFAAFVIVFAGWMFKGMSYKDYKGNTINSGPLGKYETDRHGNTTHIGN